MNTADTCMLSLAEAHRDCRLASAVVPTPHNTLQFCKPHQISAIIARYSKDLFEGHDLPRFWIPPVTSHRWHTPYCDM
jgi:hypothetical protein